MNSNRNDRYLCLQWRFAQWQECFNYVARWQRRGWDQVSAVIHMHFDCIRQTSGTNSTSWLRCHRPTLSPFLFLPLPLTLSFSLSLSFSLTLPLSRLLVYRFSRAKLFDIDLPDERSQISFNRGYITDLSCLQSE